MRIVKLMVKKYFEFLEDECKEEFKDASLDTRCYRFNLMNLRKVVLGMLCLRIFYSGNT